MGLLGRSEVIKELETVVHTAMLHYHSVAIGRVDSAIIPEIVWDQQLEQAQDVMTRARAAGEERKAVKLLRKAPALLRGQVPADLLHHYREWLGAVESAPRADGQRISHGDAGTRFTERSDVCEYLESLGDGERRSLVSSSALDVLSDMPDDVWAVISTQLDMPMHAADGSGHSAPGFLIVTSDRLFFLSEPPDAALLFSSWPGGIEGRHEGRTLWLGVRDASRVLAGQAIRETAQSDDLRLLFLVGCDEIAPDDVARHLGQVDRFLQLPPRQIDEA